MVGRMIGVACLTLVLCGTAAAQQPGSAHGRMDPRAVADWLPRVDPWYGRDVLPREAFCQLRVDDRPYDARRYRRPDDAARGVVLVGRCVPYIDYLSLYRPWLSPYDLRDVAELERARERLRRDAYPLGPHGEDARFGDPYSGTPDPYPEEHRLRRQLGEEHAPRERRVSGAAAEQAVSCARVAVRVGERRQDVRIALPALGASDAEALADAIERELENGRQVNIAGIDGLALRLLPTDRISRLVVIPCGY